MTLTAPLLKLFNLRQKTSTKQRYYHNTTVNTPRNINSSTGQQKLWTQQRKTKTFNVKKQYTIQRFNNRINNKVVTIERKKPPRYQQQLWFQQVYLYLNTTVSTLEWLYFIKKPTTKNKGINNNHGIINKNESYVHFTYQHQLQIIVSTRVVCTCTVNHKKVWTCINNIFTCINNTKRELQCQQQHTTTIKT